METVPSAFVLQCVSKFVQYPECGKIEMTDKGRQLGEGVQVSSHAGIVVRFLFERKNVFCTGCYTSSYEAPAIVCG